MPRGLADLGEPSLVHSTAAAEPPKHGAHTSDRLLRDIVAISTLPAIWTGADPLRIAESLAAALFTTLGPEFVYVTFPGPSNGSAIEVAQIDRYESSNSLAAAVGPAILDWAHTHDPDEIMLLPKSDGSGSLRVGVRSLGPHAEFGVIAVAFSGEDAPTSDHELVLNVGASQATAAIQNARLLQSTRDSDGRLRELNAELALETRTLEILNRIGLTIAAELDPNRAVQAVTDAATELTGAAFGSFFYNLIDDQGERYMPSTLSGAPKAAFSKFPLPRNTAVFGPTFKGEGIVRSDDILKDPRYGKNDPYFGMPKGHLPVRSYLAASVISRSGEVLGGLFFGHPEPGMFTERSERLLTGIAAQAATAIDNGRAYQAAQSEIAERKRAEQALAESEERLRQANTELAQHVTELEAASLEIQEARRAALNLMEDSVELRRAAEEGERRLREIIDALPAAVYTTDAEGRVTHFNPAAVEFSGRTPELGTDRWCVSWKLYYPDGRPMPHDECPMSIALKEARPVRDAEAIIERPDGQRSWFMPFPTPLRGPDGRVVGGINMLVDITQRKQAEQRQQLLMNELAHRGKNLLAVVQTLVSRSLSGARSLAEARETLTQRIQALARSQTLLVNGAFDGALVTEIVRLEFAGFSDRVDAVGPAVILNPRAAQTFALLVHELATNATKYGALSRPEGRIAINWSIGRSDGKDSFKFQWLERGGPPVTAPTRQGFGRILIERAAAQDFGAKPTINFETAGLAYEIEAPLSKVVGGGMLSALRET